MTPPCFYCGMPTPAKSMGDHMPIPRRNGGTMTVPACISCHQLKDSFSLAEWSPEMACAVIRDMPLVGRETRIFLAKMLAVASDMSAARGAA
jgi:hypothetical protein